MVIEIVSLEDGSNIVKNCEYCVLHKLRESKDEAYDVTLLYRNFNRLLKESSKVIDNLVFVGKGGHSSIVED